MRFSVCVVPVVAGLALAAPLAGQPNLTPAVRRADAMEKRYDGLAQKRSPFLKEDDDDELSKKRGIFVKEDDDGVVQKKRSPIDDGGDNPAKKRGVLEDDDPRKRGILAASTEEKEDNGDGFEKRSIF